MDKKKDYIAPEMETVELKAQVNLLEESDIHGDTAFAPHEQDPLA
ncbi:hypothetical protein [Fibrobacter sp. UWR2]|nr:hypothetical protein [Fibrobacter sp. UWR2]